MKRTAFAQQGLDFVTLFSAKFQRTDVDGYGVQIREPADSTAGGRQALQQIFFVPPRAEDPVLTVGTVNVATKTAKLRTFDCVETLYARRFRGKRFPVRPAAYQAFFDTAMQFMKRQGMQVDVETRPPEALRSSRPPPADGLNVNLVIALLALTVVAIGVALVTAYVLTGRPSF
ncbi:MAG: hypothetical protein AAGN82_25550 [Myxococcota bacterium]